MASKKTLNARNLEAIGAERLAVLLVELGTGDAALKRRLRMELAAGNPGELAKEIRKRLTLIARVQSLRLDRCSWGCRRSGYPATSHRRESGEGWPRARAERFGASDAARDRAFQRADSEAA